MRIGTSLSLCVKDICEGRVGLFAITCIITGTRAVTDEQWQRLIKSYRDTYWVAYPDQAERVVESLRSTGRIIQPRVNGQLPPATYSGHWIDVDVDETGAWSVAA